MAEINLSGPPHHSLGRYFLGLLLGLLRTDLDVFNLEKSRIISAEDGTILCFLTCLRPYVRRRQAEVPIASALYEGRWSPTQDS